MNISISFVNTGFNIRNVYNLTVGMKMKDENSINSASNFSYQIGKLQVTYNSIQFFITKLVSTVFLTSGHILIYDNASIYFMEENKSLMEILWEQKRILLLYLPTYSPHSNPIELVFQSLGMRLCYSKASHETRDNFNDIF